jgi:Ca2+-binding EF-hand superfamily protein
MSLTPEECKELEENFEFNDANNDGSIEFDEFVNMLTNMDAQMSVDEARIDCQSIDTNNDGAIALDEFIEWWRGR